MCPIKKGGYTQDEAESPGMDEFIEDEEEEEEEQERPKKEKKHSKAKYDDDDEDEEDEDANDYEMDDFVVNDAEISEEEEEPVDQENNGEDEEKEHHKKKKHRRRKKDIELDEEDLELIQENEGGRAAHSRLKKTKEISRSRVHFDDDDDVGEHYKEPSIGEEQNDFIEEEDFIEGGMEMEEDRGRKKRPARRGENFNILAQVFGQSFEGEEEYAEDRKDDEDEDMTEEEKRAALKKKYDQLFDPAELQDKFATMGDESIVQEDVPERLQLRYKARFCDNNELVQETNWIADKMIMTKGLIDKNSENFRKNIMKVLELLRISFFEIMYIHTYKANEISLKPGELKLQDLWKINDLDMDWTTIWSRRKLLEKSFEKLQTFMIIPDLVNQLYNISFDKFNLDNLLEYCEFQTLLHPEIMNEVNENPEKQFKRSTKQYLKPEIKGRFDDFSAKYLLLPDQFAENIQENKLKNAPPYIEELLTDLTNRFYVEESISKISSTESFLTQLCDYAAKCLFYHPIIRKVIYRQYFEKILVSTEPTVKGRKEIDIYNINYCVKRIDGRPLNKLEDEIWLRAVQNEKEGKIKIKFHFRWKDFNSDEIFGYLKNYYLYDSKIKNEATSQWNILRTEALTLLLKSHMYPYLEKVIRQDLTENAEKFVVQEAGKKFKEMISAAPYTKSVGDDVITDIKVMSFIPDDNNKVICTVVDKNGEYLDHKSFNFLLINPRRSPLEYISKQNMEEEDLKRFLEKFRPDLLVVGADNLSAKILVQYLRGQAQKWHDDVKNVWIKYGDMTAPKIYAKIELSKKEFPNFPARIKESISLARLQQSPLHECLKLWNHRKEENGLLYIIFHDLQGLVSNDKLVLEFEKNAIEVTNQVGIDINKLLRHPHLTNAFQFICGLGPRKAKKTLEEINLRNNSLKSRRELNEDKIVGKNVFVNMAGFIKVVDYDGDLLDTTRVHPNDYRLAQKIAKDALDDSGQTEDYIKTIMEKPQKLDELDLDDYATHLETKGKTNMKIVLDFLVNELTRPFADPRGAHREMDHKELFYKMTKMHPFDLQNGQLVNARVTRVTDKNIICRLECGIEGNIFIRDVFEEKEAHSSLPKKFHEGQVVTARINTTQFDDKSKRKDDATGESKPIDFTKLQLMLRPSMVTKHEDFLKKLHPSVEDTFRIIAEEDFPITQSTSSKQARYITRKINHPKFKNASGQGALNYLEDKEIGDFIIRPSSKGMDHLTLTWKFYDGIYVHLDIKESAKAPGDRIGKRLHLKDHIYESIDELAAGYVQSCNSFVKNITQSSKFLNENPNRIEEVIKQEKEENPKLIPYRFGFSVEAPQFLVLYYAPRDYNVIKEYIKVKPNGLQFHDKIYQNIAQLVSWFKSNYHKPEYQKYLKAAKPPLLIKPATQVKGEKSEPGVGQSVNTPTHNRGFDDIKIKSERGQDIYVKPEKGLVKEEDSRNGYRDRNMNKGGSGRPGGDFDRNKPRDFNNNRDRPDRPRHERSRSREKEKNFDRGGGDRGGYRGDDRNKDRYRERSKERGSGGGGRGGYNGNKNGSGRGWSQERGDRRDVKKEGGSGNWGGSPGWNRENRNDSSWGGDVAGNDQKIKTEAPAGAWGAETPKAKQEGGFGQNNDSGW